MERAAIKQNLDKSSNVKNPVLESKSQVSRLDL